MKEIRVSPESEPASPQRARPRLLCPVSALVLLAIGAAASSPTPVAPGAGARKREAVSATSAVPVARPKFDYSGIGGSVYATGLGDVVVTVHPVRSFLSDGFYPYVMTVSARQGERERLLGSNREYRVINLGRLERGEIRLVGRCPDGDGIFEAGAADRNADGAAHSRVKQVRPGEIEVYFENTMIEGKRNDRTEQHWYKDCKLVFTGAVTAEPGINFLLDQIDDPDSTKRQSAREALRSASPEVARQAGIR